MKLATAALRQRVLGETVFLETSKGHYFELNETGTQMLEFLERFGEIEPVVAEMVKCFEVEPAACREDLQALIDALHKAKLIELDSG